MKRLIALLLVFALCFGLCACAVEEDDDRSNRKSSSSKKDKDDDKDTEKDDCDHEFEDGVCTICGEEETDVDICDHEIVDGVCTLCGLEVPVPPELLEFDTNSPVTIQLNHPLSINLQGILEDAIAGFNRLYPNITVVHTYSGSYDDLFMQTKIDITSGNQPNLVYCYADHVATYKAANAVQPLDDLIADERYGLTDAQIADFVPAYYNEGMVYGDGQMYTLPISRSTEVLYYNKSFFDAYGLTVPKTWDEMEAVCEKIKQIDPSCIPLGYDSEANWFINMCEQYGSEYTSLEGEHFRFDNEINWDFVKRFRTWYQNGWVTTAELYGGYTSSLFTEAYCYMCIGSTGGAIYQRPAQMNGAYLFEVGITSIPQVNPNEPKVISQGPSICVLKNEDPQKVIASWLFAKYLATDLTFQASISMSNGYAPVIRSVTQNPVYAAYLQSASTANIQAYATKIALDQADAYFVSPAFHGSADARKQVGLLIQKCLAATTTDVDGMIRKAFEDAVKECKYLTGQ